MMKLFTLIFSLLLVNSAQAGDSSMKELANEMGDVFNFSFLPDGYKGEPLLEYPKFSEGLKKRLAELEAKQLEVWKTYVDSSGEFEHLGKDGKDAAKANPQGYFKSTYVVKISDGMKVLKDGVVIGYVFYIVDYVDAAIIEDGSWIVMYLDENMNIVAEEAGQA